MMLLLAMLACSSDRHLFVQVEPGVYNKVQIDGNLDSDVLIAHLHGGPLDVSRSYNAGRFSDNLEAAHAVAWIDQRQAAGSVGTFDPDELTTDLARDDMATVLEVLVALHPDKTLVVAGHSWGGQLGTRVVAETQVGQDRVAGWVSMGACHRGPGDAQGSLDAIRAFEVPAEGAEWAAARESWAGFIERADELDARARPYDDQDIQDIQVLANDSNWLLPWDQDPSVHDRGLWERRGTYPGRAMALAYSLQQAAYLEDVTPQLLAMQTPKLLIYGEHDWVCPRNSVQDDHELSIYEGGNHYPQSTSPDEMADEILTFIDGVR